MLKMRIKLTPPVPRAKEMLPVFRIHHLANCWPSDCPQPRIRTKLAVACENPSNAGVWLSKIFDGHFWSPKAPNRPKLVITFRKC